MSSLINSHEQVREAWRLALSGDIDGARRLLLALNQSALSVEGADLLARLAVRDGRFAEAQELWITIRQVAPTHGPSAKALAYLDSPWLFRAVCRKLITMLVLASGTSLAAIGGWALLVNIPDGHLSILLAACLAIMVAMFLAGVGVWVLFRATPSTRPPRKAAKEDQ